MGYKFEVEEMKHSIRRQITVIFICVLVFILGTLFVVNMGFLERYYFSYRNKRPSGHLQRCGSGSSKRYLQDDDVQHKILYQVEKMNIDLIV